MAELECREWLRFAENDLEAAKYLMGMPERKLEIICYHCQQCAEKAIKGLYALKEIGIPKTHDFRVLATGIHASLDMADQEAAFSTLQPFAVVVRYPYEIELVSGDEERAIAAADAILSRCKAYIGQ